MDRENNLKLIKNNAVIIAKKSYEEAYAYLLDFIDKEIEQSKGELRK